MKIQTIFEAFEQFRLGEDEPSQLLAWVVSGLQKVSTDLLYFYILTLSGFTPSSRCNLKICFKLRSLESSFAYREQWTNLYPYPFRFL